MVIDIVGGMGSLSSSEFSYLFWLESLIRVAIETVQMVLRCRNALNVHH